MNHQILKGKMNKFKKQFILANNHVFMLRQKFVLVSQIIHIVINPLNINKL